MRHVLLIMVLLLFSSAFVTAEDFADLNEKGNAAFESEAFNEALDYYHEAEIEKPETPEIYYNQANALVKVGKFDEANEKFSKALNSMDIGLQANSYYNQGNSNFLKEDYVEAINSYEQCLNIRPEDVDAKYNLELARVRLKEQMERKPQDQEDQQKQQQEQEKQEQEEQQKQEEEQSQEQGEEEQKQEEQQQQQESGDENNDEQQQQPQFDEEQLKQQEEEMSKEDAERLLNSLEDMEDQKNKRKIKLKGTYTGNAW